jgi:hypothetical protein
MIFERKLHEVSDNSGAISLNRRKFAAKKVQNNTAQELLGGLY